MTFLVRISNRIKGLVVIKKNNRHNACRLSKNIMINDATVFRGMNVAYDGGDLRGADIGFMSYMG